MQTIQRDNGARRQPYFDFLRGISICMVAAIHSFDAVYRFDSLTFSAVFVRQILNAAVPVFCVSSAYFLINTNTGGRAGYADFLKKHVLRVYIPLLIFSLPYFVHDILSGKNICKAAALFFTCSYSVYYFIALIIQFYILLPLFQKYRLFRNIYIGFAVSFVWVFVYCYAVRQRFSVPLILYAGAFPCFWVYFSIGAAAAKGEIKTRNLVCLITAAAALVLCAAESLYLMQKTETTAGVGLKPSAVLFSSVLVAVLYSKKTVPLYRHNVCTGFFESLGRFSLGIYLGHIFVQDAVLRFAFPYIQNGGIPGGILWSCLTVCTVLITYLLLRAAKKVFPGVSGILLGV